MTDQQKTPPAIRADRMLRAVTRHRACGLLDQFSGHRVLESEMGFQARSRKMPSAVTSAGSATSASAPPTIFDAAAAEPIFNAAAADPALLVQLPDQSEAKTEAAGAEPSRTDGPASEDNSISPV